MLNRRSGLSYKSWRAVNFGIILSLVILLIVGLSDINKIICQAVLDTTHLPFQKLSSSLLELANVNGPLATYRVVPTRDGGFRLKYVE